jgi:hypothetical protein
MAGLSTNLLAQLKQVRDSFGCGRGYIGLNGCCAPLNEGPCGESGTRRRGHGSRSTGSRPARSRGFGAVCSSVDVAGRRRGRLPIWDSIRPSLWAPRGQSFNRLCLVLRDRGMGSVPTSARKILALGPRRDPDGSVSSSVGHVHHRGTRCGLVVARVRRTGVLSGPDDSRRTDRTGHDQPAWTAGPPGGARPLSSAADLGRMAEARGATAGFWQPIGSQP